jgi:hypothetical protein
MFYRQRIFVIDGKYSSDDGLSTTAMISGAVIIGEEQQLCSLDLFLNSRWPTDFRERTEEEDRFQTLDPSAGPDHRWIKENLHAF